jgi:GNAT superfamily N-acetyltransferase
VEDLVVRRATSSDLDELCAMRRAFTEEDPPEGLPRADYEEAFRDLVGRGLEDGTWVVWVAEIDDEIIAHAFVAVVGKVPRPVESPSFIGYLTNVYTRPSHRDRGVGGRLLQATTEWAREHGVELLFVWPSERSVGLYGRHGFISLHEPLVWFNDETVVPPSS